MPYSFCKNLCRKYALFFALAWVYFISFSTYFCTMCSCCRYPIVPLEFLSSKRVCVSAHLLTLQIFREVFLPISKCPVFDAVVTKMHQYITGPLLLSYTAMLMKIMHVNLCRHNPAELSTTCAYCTDDRRVVRADFNLGMFKT